MLNDPNNPESTKSYPFNYIIYFFKIPYIKTTAIALIYSKSKLLYYFCNI